MVRRCPSTAGVQVQTPGQGTKILQAQCGKKKKEKKKKERDFPGATV